MTQLREEAYFTKGRVIVRGKTVARGEAKKADYLLYLQAQPPHRRRRGQGQQPRRGARACSRPSNTPRCSTCRSPSAPTATRFWNTTARRSRRHQHVEREFPSTSFPSPDDLWARYSASQGAHARAGSHRHPGLLRRRLGQDAALLPAQRHQPRPSRPSPAARTACLLVMATGTGKTYTAFQIIWRLWKSGAKKRILFLVDRNILADQTKTNDFKPFGQAMTKITNRTVDKSYEIYLSLYQAVTGTEEEQNIYKQFSPDFFDLVIVDECHRGSAADDAAWREILEYFSSATQIGLTATPKETKDVSNIDYFGEPIYTYSLRQGIADGFLAPYKVVRIGLDKDLDGWRPEKGQTDKLRPARSRTANTTRPTSTRTLSSRSAPARRRQDHRVPQGHRPLRQDHRLLRGHRPRRADAPGAGQRQRRPGGRQPQATSCGSRATTTRARPSSTTSSTRMNRFPSSPPPRS